MAKRLDRVIFQLMLNNCGTINATVDDAHFYVAARQAHADAHAHGDPDDHADRHAHGHRHATPTATTDAHGHADGHARPPPTPTPDPVDRSRAVSGFDVHPSN